jgi:hypothetical protein
MGALMTPVSCISSASWKYCLIAAETHEKRRFAGSPECGVSHPVRDSQGDSQSLLRGRF